MKKIVFAILVIIMLFSVTAVFADEGETPWDSQGDIGDGRIELRVQPEKAPPILDCPMDVIWENCGQPPITNGFATLNSK